MAELRFKYSSSQPHQQTAIDAVCDLFRGQEFLQSEFTAERASDTYSEQQHLPGEEFEPVQRRLHFDRVGYANGLRLSQRQLEMNLHAIQESNAIEPTTVMPEGKLRDFTIEMETGTGKTYCYIRTIYELHERYGLSKFVIVVPSVAIREGVLTSFKSMKEHFDGLYDHAPIDVFIYDSSKPTEVGNFALSQSIQVMIINISAFNKEIDKAEKARKASEAEQDKAQKSGGNLFFRPSEKLPGGRSPQEMVAECNPIVIIDEPQSVEGTKAAKASRAAIGRLNPLFILRYSATHRERYNMLYQLGPVDAFNLELVKGICVDSVLTESDLNGAYVRLESVKADPYRATLTIDVRQKDGTQKRRKVTVKPGDLLYEKSNGNSDYRNGFQVTNISTAEGRESITFGGVDTIGLGKAIGDVTDAPIKRAQIRRTIEDHLEKQLEMWPLGIKVLSLFFIDKVEKYRTVDDEDGEYARWFDEIYREVVGSTKWQDLYAHAGIALPTDPGRIREGYFSQDGKTKKLKDTNGTTTADETTFKTIMESKERLVTFYDEEHPDRVSEISFIWSHSTLKEGWDNPNVFQICTLVDTASALTKRQKIGRGLRLPVDQRGERCHDASKNVLTVIANESYREFATGLQREFESEGISFGIITTMSFAKVCIEDGHGCEQPIGAAGSKKIYASLEAAELIDGKGHISSKLKETAEQGITPLPEQFEPARDQIQAIIIQKAQHIQIRDKSKQVAVELQKDVTEDPEFQALWNRIRQKTKYRVEVNSSRIIDEAIEEILTMGRVQPPLVVSERASLSVQETGITTNATDSTIMTTEARVYDLPDPIKELQDAVGLTRRTIKCILEGIGDRYDEFAIDPATFLSQVGARINRAKFKELSRGIKYTRLPEDEWYTMAVLEVGDLKAYVDQNAWKPERPWKTIYTYVVYDSSTVEKPFAVALDKAEEIKVYAKLPSDFTIDTPIGPYNPDWAYVQEIDGEQKVFFVVETKGGGNADPTLRPEERIKTDCARRHFAALDGGVTYDIRTTYANVKI